MSNNLDSNRPVITDEGIIDMPGLASRWVRLADGRRAHYVTSGDKGPAVVLLHGGIEGSSGTAGFRFMAPFLAAHGFRVYCPDRPGFGLADKSKPEYLNAGRKANVEFLKNFADALCLDEFHLSGNSAGCIVSADFVITHPERVLSVAYIAGALGNILGYFGEDMGANFKIPPSQGKFTPNPSFTMEPWDGTPESMKSMMDSIIYRPEAVWPELIQMRCDAGLAFRKARAAFGMSPTVPMSEMMGDPDNVFSMKDRLTNLKVPMIYMYGLLDVLLPVENGFQQEDAAENIQFFYPDHTGHQGQSDSPELFNQTFLEFFRDGKVSWPTAQAAGVSLRRPINADLVEEPAGGFPELQPNLYTDIDTLRNGWKSAGLATELEAI